MKKHKWILFFLLLGFFACDENETRFETSAEGLKIEFKPVPGGAMLYYALPNNSDIFSMNVRYADVHGKNVLKTCGYGGDSLLLDGFTESQEARANISFVNHRDEESEPLEYNFNTLESAPWSFFNGLEVQPSWNGFRMIYKSPSVVTGMVHVFYLGTNPVTQSEDTLLLRSFPISRGGDTLQFTLLQERAKNTIVVRTEDYQGYRVKQGVYPGIDAFLTEQLPLTVENFDDGGISKDDIDAKTGKEYLFDGELKGKERLISSFGENQVTRPYTAVYATYLAGPYAYGKPMILDLKEQKIPAWIRLYCLYPLRARHTSGNRQPLGMVWNNNYEDKLPCDVDVYGSKESADPNTGEWVRLGSLKQDPKALKEDRWTALATVLNLAPEDESELETKKPIYTDVVFPPVNNSYRYLKIVVNNTFATWNLPQMNFNRQQYFTLHELEVFLKKEI